MDAFQIASQPGGVPALTAAILRDEVDLAIADLPAIGESDLGLLEAALASRPRVTLILVCSDASTDFLLRAMRAGIREVVVPGSPAGALAEAVTRQLERHAAVSGPARKARTIAFLSAKGGGGATFLATNLGSGHRRPEAHPADRSEPAVRRRSHLSFRCAAFDDHVGSLRGDRPPR